MSVRKNKKFSIPRCFFESEGVVFYGVYYEHRQETLRQIPFTEQYFPENCILSQTLTENQNFKKDVNPPLTFSCFPIETLDKIS